MRTRTAFVPYALVAAVGLLAATDAMAHGYPAPTCAWTVTPIEGPCLVNAASPDCNTPGDFTGIKYQITGSSFEKVVTLVTANNVVSTLTGNVSYPPGAGDPYIDLGDLSFHEKAVKVNVTAGTFWVVVEGKKQPVQTTVALKKSSCIKAYPVLGFGLDTNKFQAVQPKDVVKFKGCTLEFTKDPLTGEVVGVPQFSPDSAPGCTLHQTTVDQLTLTVPGAGTFSGKFGDGYISGGTNSCITRVFGGNVYTWGDPCPED